MLFQVMLMENLKTDGYKLVPKRIGLDMTHIKLLLDKVSLLETSAFLLLVTKFWFLVLFVISY